ncbi:hypothetical protein [Flavihumibacter petaseus]|nr:hypothetical protein [Flavihumibacter petaseus]
MTGRILPFNGPQNGQTRSASTVLENTVPFSINLHTSYCDSADHKIPVAGNISVNGFLSGFSWETNRMRMVPDAAMHWSYTIDGTLNWKLMGFTVYREEKRFEGSLNY